jgi:hypothetical protein
MGQEHLEITDSADNVIVILDGNTKASLTIQDETATDVIRLGHHELTPHTGRILVSTKGKQTCALTGSVLVIGGNGEDGVIHLHPKSSIVAPFSPAARDSIALRGDHGTIALKNDDKTTIHLDGHQAALSVGATLNDGRIDLVSNQGEKSLNLHAHAADSILVWDIFAMKRIFAMNRDNGTLYVGATAADGGLKPGSIRVRDMSGNDSIVLDGESGDISLSSADCAEEFVIAEPEAAGPGTVVVLDENGHLRQSRDAYDRRVAGVVSGAGDYKPGLVLGSRPGQHDRMPVALVGRTCCKADAQYGAIQVGDLLTTSPTPGHAMRATDPARSFGAVIGKSLATLSAGTGTLPVLIALL